MLGRYLKKMTVAYWGGRRFEIVELKKEFLLRAYAEGRCEEQSTEPDLESAMKAAARKYAVAVSLWSEEPEEIQTDQLRSYESFLDEIRPKLRGQGGEDILLTLEGVVHPQFRQLPLPQLLKNIESYCHVRAWGDRYIEGLGYEWWNILERIKKWVIKLQAKKPNGDNKSQ